MKKRAKALKNAKSTKKYAEGSRQGPPRAEAAARAALAGRRVLETFAPKSSGFTK